MGTFDGTVLIRAFGLDCVLGGLPLRAYVGSNDSAFGVTGRTIYANSATGVLDNACPFAKTPTEPLHYRWFLGPTCGEGTYTALSSA